MRRTKVRAPAVAYPWYRVRFELSDVASKLLGSKDGVATAIPGVIRRNRPKAEQALFAMQRSRNAWLEIKDGPDSEWRKL